MLNNTQKQWHLIRAFIYAFRLANQSIIFICNLTMVMIFLGSDETKDSKSCRINLNYEWSLILGEPIDLSMQFSLNNTSRPNLA